jgi:hypothetical protein
MESIHSYINFFKKLWKEEMVELALEFVSDTIIEAYQTINRFRKKLNKMVE